MTLGVRGAAVGGALMIATTAAGAVMLVLSTGRPADPSESVTATVAGSSPAAPVTDPVADADSRDCVAVTRVLQPLAHTITEAGGSRGPVVDAALGRAEAALAEPRTTSDDRLRHAFTGLDRGLRFLRAAVVANRGVGPATDGLLRLVDEIDTTCQAVQLAPIGPRSTPTSG
jgi:hypothetical protein